jgi:metal-responsive CopG/Arc/MetJ family transcriptional regulator
MAQKQRFTVAIERELIARVRAMAERQGRSLSALLNETLRELVSQEPAHQMARQNAQMMLERGFDLQSARMLDRSEAHDRRSAG